MRSGINRFGKFLAITGHGTCGARLQVALHGRPDQPNRDAMIGDSIKYYGNMILPFNSMHI